MHPLPQHASRAGGDEILTAFLAAAGAEHRQSRLAGAVGAVVGAVPSKTPEDSVPRAWRLVSQMQPPTKFKKQFFFNRSSGFARWLLPELRCQPVPLVADADLGKQRDNSGGCTRLLRVPRRALCLHTAKAYYTNWQPQQALLTR